jgi:hypothetical protein
MILILEVHNATLLSTHVNISEVHKNLKFLKYMCVEVHIFGLWNAHSCSN